MRVLWLKTDLLLPLDKGGKLRTWHLMRHLAKRHEITYLAFAEPQQPDADIRGMYEVCHELITVLRTDPPKRSLRFYAGAAWRLADPLPYAVGKYRSRAFARRLQKLLRSRRFDVIVCDFLPPIVNLPRTLPCPAVLFTHNVEAEIWRRHADTHARSLTRPLFAQQHRRMLKFEGRALARFDGVLAVSQADNDTFARLYPDAIRRPVHVVPTGVDTSYFAPADPASPPTGRNIVFTGSMDWLPNEDAMVFFSREILPLIRRDEPDVTLSIVGRAPTPAVTALAAQHGVTVTGRVDDVRPYVREAAVYIVPLRIGGGTRLKIFEAMAMGKAVVSTHVGAEGLPVSHGQHILLADEPHSFSHAIVKLLRDVERRKSLEREARALVVSRYDWSAVAGELEDALMRFAGARSSEIELEQNESRRSDAELVRGTT